MPAPLFACPAADAGRAAAERWFVRYAGRVAPATRQRLRVSPRVGADAGRFPRRVERALSAVLPAGPAAVMLFDRHGFGRTLVFDLDAKRVGWRQVATDVASLLAVLGSCGVPWLRDGSVSGGEHVYVPLATPRHVSEIGRLLRAAARLLPSLDISLVNVGEGCIRPPGSPHRHGGFQRLLCSEGQADQAFAHPAGEEAWARLGAALADARPAPPEPPAMSGEVLAGRSWAPLPGRFERIARTGEAAGYASGSEARQAVLASAANRGWHLADVEARIEDGRWAGLRGLYARYRGGWQRALRRDWAKAVGWAGTKSDCPDLTFNTRCNSSRHAGSYPQWDRGQLLPDRVAQARLSRHCTPGDELSSFHVRASKSRDTPTGIHGTGYLEGMIAGMPGIPGRKQRKDVGSAVAVFIRVPPELRDKAHLAAGALGVAVTAYLEQLLLRDDLDESGRPAWAEDFFAQHPEFGDPHKDHYPAALLAEELRLSA